MNDISVKIVESQRDQVPGSPSMLAGANSDLDPLVINEGDAPLTEESYAEGTSAKTPQEIEKAGTCDDDAKEKIISESLSEDNSKKQTEDSKGKLFRIIITVHAYINLYMCV